MSIFRSPEIFWYFSSRTLYQSTIVITFRPKKVLYLVFFWKVARKSTVYRLSRLHFWGQKCFFRPEIFGRFLVESLSEHPLWSTFRPKKVLYFAFFRKIAPKSTVYRLSRFTFFEAKNVFFDLNIFCRFLVDSLSEHHCEHFWPKKSAGHLAFFRKVAQKVQSIGCLDCIFSSPTKLNFSANRFFVFFLVDSLSEHPLCALSAEKSASDLAVFSKSCLQKVQSIGYLDCIFELSIVILFDQLNLFFNFSSWFFISASIVYLFQSKKVLRIWPVFLNKSCLRKVQSIGCLDLIFSTNQIFVNFFCWIAYQSAIVITFIQKKCRFLSFFEKLLEKVQSIGWSRFHFFDQLDFFKILFLNHYQSIHCDPFQA